MGNATSGNDDSSSWIRRSNTRLSFDYAHYIADRRELAADLRSLATAAKQHRQTQGTWQMAQGTAGVTTGVASSVAVVALLVVAPAAAATAAVAGLVGKSVAAASLASSAAMYTHGHVVDKDMALRLRNLYHDICSIAARDDEMNRYFCVTDTVDKQNKSTPREWEWWGDGSVNNSDDKNQHVPLEVQQRQANREAVDPIHANACAMALCCVSPQELVPFSISI